MAYYESITREFTWDNTPLLISAGFSFLIGYLQYFYAIKLMLTDGRGPFPIWMHIFYLAHDSAFSYILGRAAPHYDNHFFLRGSSIAYAIWSILEIFCIYHAIRYHRRENFSPALGERSVSLGTVLQYTIFMQAAMYCVVILLIDMLGEGCSMQWGCLTNVLMIVGPTHDYIRRGSNDGLAVGFCVVNVFCAIWTFAPFGMFVRTLPEVFETSTYYNIGCILFVYSLWLLSIVATNPPKTGTVSKRIAGNKSA